MPYKRKSKSEVSRVGSWVRQSPASGAVVAFVLVLVVMAIFGKGVFLSTNNLVNIIRQGAVLSIVAIGQTFVILSGGIDLSVAPLVSLGTVVVSACIVHYNWNLLLACLLAMAVCALLGCLNGVLITLAKIPPIIATLASAMAFQGICLLYSKGYGINLPQGHALTEVLGRGKIGGFPLSGVLMLLIYLFFFLILRYTKFGRVTYGIGGNAEAVRLSGISLSKYSIYIYTLSGLMAGVAGILLTGRLNCGHPYNGEGMDLNSIAAVVLGGASVSGGVGTIGGTLMGVFILTMIENGLNMMNMNPYLQQMVKGLIIVIAVGFGSLRERKN
ncbi:MAG: ABC transporter permease [Blautia sp.]